MSLFENNFPFDAGQEHRQDYDLPDAAVVYWEHFFDIATADTLYNTLLENTPWKQEHIQIYGKSHQTPRLTAWYGDAGQSYSFSGTRMDPYPWTPELLLIKEKTERRTTMSFNSVLLNLYRTGKDSVSWHRDNEIELGRNPVIASVSFGETRPFQLRHKFRKDLPTVSIPLKHGSLLVMSGSTQHCWEHQIPKTTKDIHPRINLTFRIMNG